MSTVDPAKLSRRLSSIKHVLLVLSGKGGVGKSSVAVQLALSLLDRPAGDDESEDSQPRRIGLLDVDLTGPSIPRMLGLDGAAVHQSADGWVPVYLPLKKAGQDDDKDASQTNGQASKEGKETAQNGVHGRDDSRDEFKVMSIGFLLRDSRQAVVWRGPKKSAMIRQFLADVRWGELDWLIIDTPPGTSDEHISLLENLMPALQSSTSTTLNSILVTTPQAVSLSDVSKELSFTRRTGLPVLGLIENMSGYICPHCSVIHNIFGRGGGEDFCRLETEKAEKEGRPAEKLRFLGRLPVDSQFVKVVDGPESGVGLVERYKKTQSSILLKDITAQIAYDSPFTPRDRSGSIITLASSTSSSGTSSSSSPTARRSWKATLALLKSLSTADDDDEPDFGCIDAMALSAEAARLKAEQAAIPVSPPSTPSPNPSLRSRSMFWGTHSPSLHSPFPTTPQSAFTLDLSTPTASPIINGGSDDLSYTSTPDRANCLYLSATPHLAIPIILASSPGAPKRCNSSPDILTSVHNEDTPPPLPPKPYHIKPRMPPRSASAPLALFLARDMLATVQEEEDETMSDVEEDEGELVDPFISRPINQNTGLGLDASVFVNPRKGPSPPSTPLAYQVWGSVPLTPPNSDASDTSSSLTCRFFESEDMDYFAVPKRSHGRFDDTGDFAQAAYHSSFNEGANFNTIGNMAILPLKTRVRGPAPAPADPSEIDILDESLTLFRANSLFRNFEIKGPADRTLIYFILFISDCISRIGSPNAKHWNTVEATKQLTTLALESFSLPGEPGFPLNSVFSAPANRTDADNLRAYLSQARQELAPRIVQTVYDETGKPSKWWMAFQKRRFMGKSLSGP
ncbi:cytosolic Fe-S cluster assembly factor cfd1 [Cystobasidiomycetes sp. EMM_F5]